MKKTNRSWKARALSAALSLTMLVGLLPMAGLTASAADVTEPALGTTVNGLTLKELKVEDWVPTLRVSSDSSEGSLYAAVLPTLEYKPDSEVKLERSTYANLAPGTVVDTDFGENYRYAAPMADKTGAGSFSFNSTLSGIEMNESSTDYQQQYRFIVFQDKAGGTGVKGAYLMADIWVDAEGNSVTRDESYMIRYLNNDTSAGSSQPVYGKVPYSITKPVTADTTLSTPGADYGRLGYTFLGWDTDGAKLGSDANAAATSTVTPAYAAGSAYRPDNAEANKIYDLAAIWKPVGVGISYVSSYGTPKVGEYFAMRFKITGSEDTNKKLEIQTGTLPAGLTTMNKYGTGEYFGIEGTPTEKTDKETTLTVKVTDLTNNTTATVDVTLPEIVKGDTDAPKPDWNTGLQGFGISADEAADGKIVGFYPTTPGAGGEVYLSEGRVYEYRVNTTADATKDSVDGWSEWFTLNSDGQLGVSETKGEGVEPATPVGQGVKVNTTTQKCIALTGLEKGLYEVRFKETPTINATSSVYVTLGVGSSDVSSQPGYSFVYNLAGGMFDAGHTTEMQTNGLIGGAEVVLTRDEPTREGYLFQGWTDGTLENGALKTYKYAQGATEDIVLTIADQNGSVAMAALWQADGAETKYKVRFNLAGGSAPTEDEAAAAYQAVIQAGEAGKKTGETLALTAAATPVRTGYDFKGWTDGTHTYAAPLDGSGKITLAGADVYLSAIWEKSADKNSTFSVVPHLAGGQAPDPATSYNDFWNNAKGLKDKDKLQLTAASIPVRSGYTFLGWRDGDTLYAAEDIREGGDKAVVTVAGADVILVAEWATGTTYKLNFNLAQGTLDAKAQAAIDALNAELVNATSATSKTLPADLVAVPADDTAVFSGWSDGKVLYVPGKTGSDTVAIDGELTLAAVYKSTGSANVVLYNLAGGAIATADQEDWTKHQTEASGKDLGADYTFTVTSIVPTRTGYTFGGWDDGSGNIYRDGSAAEKSQIVDGNGTTALSARWSYDSKYRVYFGLAGGKIDTKENSTDLADWEAFLKTASSLEDKAELAIPSIIPVRAGFTFVGWSTGSVDETNAAIYYNYSEAPDATQNKVKIDGADVVLNAVWAPTTAAFGAISYFDWDGTLLGSSIVAKTTTAAELTGVMKAFADTKRAENADGYGYAADTSKPLTNKLGYKFNDVWLYAQSDAFECYRQSDDMYGNYLPANHDLLSAYTAEVMPDAAKILSDLTANGTVELKAAYEAQANINSGNFYYTFAPSSYNSLAAAKANAGQYSIRLTVLRQDNGGGPVARLREPALVVAFQPAIAGAAVNYIRVPLDNVDVADTEIVVDKNTKQSNAYLIDAKDVSNWFKAEAVSQNNTEARWDELAGKGSDGFVSFGTVRGIYDAALARSAGGSNSAWITMTNTYAFQDAGLDISGTTAGAARTAILNAVKKCVEDGYLVPLTKTQMQSAIDGSFTVPNA